MTRRDKGFTLIELLVVITIIGILAAIALPNYIKAKNKAKEAETKANCHTIQISLERYMTDNMEYPHYLLGGDIDGWLNWHNQWDGVNNASMPNGMGIATNDRVQDPLVEYDYITSYPGNPFVGDGQIIIRQTDVLGRDEQGAGDPRFGYKGNVMGQGLDDMNMFRGDTHPGPYFWSAICTHRTLDRGQWMNVPPAFVSDETEMYYLFGGRRNQLQNASSDVIFTFWPGNFFYKATSDQVISRQGFTIPVPNTNIGGHYNRYMLGGYGAEGTVGTDVIRLEYTDPDGGDLCWICPPPFQLNCFCLGYELFGYLNWGDPGGLPEVFGGGDAFTGPSYPYNKSESNPDEFIYGCEDGVPDGVILVLTNGSEVEKYVK
jgi:prepilin-type N-terminal cleavage/methylation domain-containing protein